MCRTRKRQLALLSSAIILIVLLVLAFIERNYISYFTQAAIGHFRVMGSREPIGKLLSTDLLDIETQNKLKLVLEVREYAAKQLGLPLNKSYTVYSEIDDKYLGWNVYCAPTFSVEPKQWCFPIAGCVVYKGYFSKKGALKFAGKMEEDGFDVFIGPINAYSTLGWYDDPLLSSHLRLDPIRLAGLIIHELAHQKLYVSGNSRFNEGFAVAVERAGVLRWLKSTGRDEQLVKSLEIWKEEDTIVAKLLNARSQLNEIYLSDSDPRSLAEKKISLFQDLKMDICGGNCAGINLPKTDDQDFELNNAYLVSIDTYYSLVPVFQSTLDSLGGNLAQFYKRVEELAEVPIRDQGGPRSE